ncbi:MAG: hypothetical protein R3B07_26990 [Polyangiaceae bacterium]
MARARRFGALNAAGCGAVLCAVLAGCGGGDRALSADDVDEAALVPARSPVQAFCGSADEAQLRLEHPELPPCGTRVYTYLKATIAGHQLLAFAHEDDPCCTDVPTPGMMLGAHVYVDGESWPTTDPIVMPAPPSTADEASAWLHAELMRRLVVQPTMDAPAIEGSWPAAGPALKRHAVGLQQAEDGWRLRAYGVSHETERGIHCRFLAVWDATLQGTRVDAQRLVQYAEGTVMGQPCSGEPLPR